MGRDEEGWDTGNLDDSRRAPGGHRCQQRPRCFGTQHNQEVYRAEAVLGGSRALGASLGQMLGAFH
jgi:hypothetical protein